MNQPLRRGGELLREIESMRAETPVLWWLGHSGFALKFHDIIFYIDPSLGDGPERLTAPPLDPAEIGNADLVLCTHAHRRHMDPATLPAMMAASPRARLVLPKSAAAHALAIGIDYGRMTTTDSDLRVYTRIYAVPSAHAALDYTPEGGYPYLGYLVRCGGCTIYHAGDGIAYETLAARLRPYNVTVALLPISGGPANFDAPGAAQLAEDIGARWLATMHYATFPGDGDVNRFIDHMLGLRPHQRFKIFQCGEGWAVPLE
ncbi:MAG: MBL fold metallo-hydrolase [Bryobacteraceae bacterium]